METTTITHSNTSSRSDGFLTLIMLPIRSRRQCQHQLGDAVQNGPMLKVLVREVVITLESSNKTYKADERGQSLYPLGANQMITRTAETSPIVHARVTAFLVLAVFGLLYIPFILIAPGDTVTTANYVIASESRFRLGIVSTLAKLRLKPTSVDAVAC
jgi:hypothetical protein